MSETARPTDQEVLNEMHRVAEKLGKEDITFKEYMEHSEISPNPRHRFDSWNDAKRKAGLELNGGGLTEEEKQEIIRKLQDLDRNSDKRNTAGNLADKTDYSKQKVADNFGGFTKLCEIAGVEPYLTRDMKSEEEIFDEIRKLEKEKKVVGLVDLKQVSDLRKLKSIGVDLEKFKENVCRETADYIVENYDHGYYRISELRADVKEEFGVRTFSGCYSFENIKEEIESRHDVTVRKSSSGGNSPGIYLDRGVYDSKDRYRREMLKRWEKFKKKLGVEYENDRELFELFIEYSGKGKAPSTVAGAIAYVKTDMSQKQIEDSIDTTELSVRKLYPEIGEQIQT